MPSQTQQPPKQSINLLGGLFQVSINAQKLSSTIIHLTEQLEKQGQEITILKNGLKMISSSVENKLEMESKRYGLICSQLELKMQQNKNGTQMYINQCYQKIEKISKEIESCFHDIENQTQNVEQKLRKQMEIAIQCVKRDVFGDEVQTVQLESLKVLDDKNQDKPASQGGSKKKMDFKSLFQTFQTQITQLKQSMKPTFEQLFSEHLQQKQQLSRADIIRRKDKSHTKSPQKMKVMYPSNFLKVPDEDSKTINFNLSQSPSRQYERDQNSWSLQRDNSMERIRSRHMSYFQRPKTPALEDVPELLAQLQHKFQEFQNVFHDNVRSLGENRNKNIVMQEKVQILSRKQEKSAQEIAEIKTHFRRLQSPKTDDKSLEELRNHLKWALKDIEDSLAKKCTIEQLQKEKIKIYEKIAIAHENMIEKADKGEVQKALFFIQEKIKELIFLIAAEQSDERQGAIMRVSAKCLSCDKEIQKQYQSKLAGKLQRDREKFKSNEGQYIKSMTHRVRQRFRKQMTKNTTLGNQSLDQFDNCPV